MRLRPVLMTALVASLGFVPMAVNIGHRRGSAAAAGHGRDRRHHLRDVAQPVGAARAVSPGGLIRTDRNAAGVLHNRFIYIRTDLGELTCASNSSNTATAKRCWKGFSATTKRCRDRVPRCSSAMPGAAATNSWSARRAGSPGRVTPASRSTTTARANAARRRRKAAALMTPFMKDRKLLLKRLQAGLATAQGHAHRRCAAHRHHGFLLRRPVRAGSRARRRRHPRRGEFSRPAETFRPHGTESAGQGTHAAWLRRSDGAARRRAGHGQGIHRRLARTGSCMPMVTPCMHSPIRWRTTAPVACNTTKPRTAVRGTRSRSSSAKSLK